MSNPVFTHSPAFNARTPAGYPTMPGYQPGSYGQAGGYGSAGAGEPNPAANADSWAKVDPTPYGFPSESRSVLTANDRLTYDDVLSKTGICFAVLLAGAFVAWKLAVLNPAIGFSLITVGAIGALVLGLVNSFKRVVSPVLILAYAALEGLFLGGISMSYNALYGGIVLKAVVATLVTFCVMLVLFKTQLIRNSPTLMRVVTVGMFSILGFYLVNFVLGFFMPATALPSNLHIMGFPLWVVVSAVAVVLAALSLVTDFDYITKAVQSGADKRLAWTAAFGLMVTLVWLYLELLRLLSYFSSSD